MGDARVVAAHHHLAELVDERDSVSKADGDGGQPDSGKPLPTEISGERNDCDTVEKSNDLDGITGPHHDGPNPPNIIH